jgi:hypothetical protein
VTSFKLEYGIFFKYTFHISYPIVFNKRVSADTLKSAPSFLHTDTWHETNSHPFKSVTATILPQSFFHSARSSAFSALHRVKTLFTAHC